MSGVVSDRTTQGLLLPRPATCSWHCLYDTRVGFPPISFQQAALLLHQKQRECSSSQRGAPSPSSPLLLPVGSQQPCQPQAWHRVESAVCSDCLPLFLENHPSQQKEAGVSGMSLLEAGRPEGSQLLLSPFWQPLWLSGAACRLHTGPLRFPLCFPP